MSITYIKKANKTASSDEVETRKRVQDVLNEIESRRDEGIKDISHKFDNYVGDVIVSKEKMDVCSTYHSHRVSFESIHHFS